MRKTKVVPVQETKPISQAGEHLNAPPADLTVSRAQTAAGAEGDKAAGEGGPALARPAEMFSPIAFDPLARLPGEPLWAYGNFRRWERDCQGMTGTDAARYLGIDQGAFSKDSRVFFWRARAEAAHLGVFFNLPEGMELPLPLASEALPERLAEMVRKREWLQSIELAASAGEALRLWRESKKAPALADVLKLLELSSRLAHLAAGMGDEGVELAATVNTEVKAQLEDALKRAYGGVEG